MFWSKESWRTHISQTKGVTGTSTKPRARSTFFDQDDDDKILGDDEFEEAEPGQRGKARTAANINVNMLYVVDKEGVPIGGLRAAEMRSWARLVWTHLLSKGLAPRKWKSDGDLKTNGYYRWESHSILISR
jgi:hypothetical protein